MGTGMTRNMAVRQKTMWPLYHLIMSTVFTSVRTWTWALLSAQITRRPAGKEGAAGWRPGEKPRTWSERCLGLLWVTATWNLLELSRTFQRKTHVPGGR